MFDTVQGIIHCCNEELQDTYKRNKRENLGRTMYVNEGNAELFFKLLASKSKVDSSTKHFVRDVQSDEMDFEGTASNTIKHTKNNDKYTAEYVEYRSKSNYKVFQKRANVKHNISSGSYNMDFIIDPQHDYIKFQFSIPKMIYGHNIAQFIPQRGSLSFYDSIGGAITWEWQKKNLHRRFRKFMDGFFNKVERDFDLRSPISKDTIEISRVDLCFNEIYPDKETSLEGLAMKFKISKKKQSKRTNFEISIKDQTLQYNTQSGMNCKIYHKGTEVRVHDLEKWQKANKDNWMELLAESGKITKIKKYTRRLARLERIRTERKLDKDDFLMPDGKYDTFLYELYQRFKNHRVFNVPFLVAEADKILRYEISISGKYFSSVYKRRIFRRSNETHLKYRKRFLSIDQDKRKIEKDLTAEELTSYNYYHKFQESKVCMMYQDRKDLQYHDKKIHPVKDFKNGCYDPYLPKGKGDYLGRYDQAYFSKGFLGLLIDDLADFIDNYRIKPHERNDDLEAIIKDYNNGVDLRVAEFNQENSLEVIRYNEDPLNQGKTKIKKAFQLLSTHQKMKLKLKKINHDRFIGFWKAFNERGQNFDAVFKDLNVQASTKNRMMKDLEMIGVTRQSFVLDQPFVNPERDFWKYYDLTMDDLYKKHFYVRIKDSERN